MKYDDIKKRLSPLNEITMSADKEQEIANVIHKATQAYRGGRAVPVPRKRSRWIGSVSAIAAATVAAAGMIVMLYTRQQDKTSNTSATTNNTTNNAASNTTRGTTTANPTVPIEYTQAQLANVQQVAKAVGVYAWIPTRGLLGDTLTMAKNGKNELTLNYKHIWIIESDQATASPQGITKQQTVDIGGTPGTFIVDGENTFLVFRKGTTYIQIENLVPDHPISLPNMKSIAESVRAAG